MLHCFENKSISDGFNNAIYLDCQAVECGAQWIARQKNGLKKMMQTRRNILLTLILLLGGVGGARSATAESTTRVLVLYSYSRLVPVNVEVDRGLDATLQGDGSGAPRRFSEFLDSPEFHGEDYENLMTAYLRGKYATSPPDVIVAVADDALNFLVRRRASLFPDVPIVHAVVSSAMLQSLNPLPGDVIGVPNDYDFIGTITQALIWHPSARRVVIITGGSWRDRKQEIRLRREAANLGVTADFWSAQTAPVLQKQLASLGRDTIVFTTGFFQDGAGNQFVPRDAVALIARASSAPVYSPFDTSIGRGVVGGKVPDLLESGAQAGRTVMEILGGIAPSSIRLPSTTPTRLHVDWRQVQRWGIDEKAIPADAVVHFRDPTLWEAHRTAVLVAISVFLIQMTLIVSLYIERRRRGAAESTMQTLNIQLSHASRLAIAGELAASIAHEINQPLGAVQMSADAADLMLQAKADRDEGLIRVVARIRSDNMRASEVIRRLRRLLAKHEPERRLFDAGLAIADVAMILRPEAERRKVTFNVQSSLPTTIIEGDQTQFQQVLINLALNAMDAAVDLPENRRLVEVSMRQEGSTMVISVCDQGHGISAENLPKVFDSFFSTKQSGMGLGLAIARSIVESHGGRIRAEACEPHGAAFHVELPASAPDSGKLRRSA
jgi:signal transduction histidine kinase